MIQPLTYVFDVFMGITSEMINASRFQSYVKATI